MKESYTVFKKSILQLHCIFDFKVVRVGISNHWGLQFTNDRNSTDNAQRHHP